MRMIMNVSSLVLVLALGACDKEPAGSGAATATPGTQAGDQAGNPGAGQAGKPPGQAGAAGTATGSDQGKPVQAGSDSPAMAEAKQIFSIRCATCHGQSGRGDGPVAANLNPRPRDYSDQAWQKETTDEQIKKIIVEGGPALGKSILMAPSPDLGQKPEVLDAMVALIRSFGK